MTQKELKLNLNDHKTEARIMQSVKTIFIMLSPLHVGSADIPFMTCACDLGFMIPDNMTSTCQMSAVLLM